MSKVEQIKQGLEFAMITADRITVSGVDNCKAITLIHNNLNIFLNMLANGEIEIIEKKSEE